MAKKKTNGGDAKKNAPLEEKSSGFNLTEEEKWTLSFARELAKAKIYDPAKRTSRATRSYPKTLAQESLYGYLQSPTTNEKALRDASIYMYLANTRYYRLLQYYSGLPTYSYVISPLNFNKAKYNKDTFRKNYNKVSNKLELMNIRDETRKQILIALREGAFYGVRWGDSLSGFTQKLNPDICQISHVSDGVFLFKVDMSKIREEDLDCYPPEFETMYQAYKDGDSQWQLVDPSISVCVKADPTIPDCSVPPFAAVLPELYVINDTQALQVASDEMDNYKLLTGTVPLDDNGVPTIDYDTYSRYYNQIANNIGERIGLAVSPFKLDSIDFSKSAAADAVDAIAQAVRNYWSAAGTSALIHGETNNTSGVTKLAIKNDETYIFSLLDQCERQINRYLKTTISGANRFKISFLRTTVYNLDDMIQRYKEGLNYGIGKSYYMAALDIPQYDIEGLGVIENEILDLESALKPLKTSSTMSGDSDAKIGRPVQSDVEETGESTRDNDSNDNR